MAEMSSLSETNASTSSSHAVRESTNQAFSQPAETICPPVREEDIGVLFEYEPPVPTSSYSHHSSGQHERSGRTRPTNQHARRSRHRGRGNRRRRAEDNFFRSYAKHWISQCVATFLTGAIFLAIGTTLIIMQLVVYIGIMFVLVSLPSFFMTIHMIRQRIRQRRLRRLYLERRQRRAIRRRQRAAENAAFRGATLPYSDLPPAYDNLVFNETNAVCDAEQDTENLSLSSISEDSEIPPPNYDDEWDKVSVVDKENKEYKNEDVESFTELKSSASLEQGIETDFSTIQNPHCSYIN